MCFSWKPGRAAINRRRHFHAPHFSWFLPEFPPFLPRSTLAPQLPTAALAADHDQQGIIGGCGGGGDWVEGAVPALWSRDRGSAWLICSDSGERAAWTAMTSGFSHHPLPVMHSPKTQSQWPTATSQELGVLPPTALVLMWP